MKSKAISTVTKSLPVFFDNLYNSLVFNRYSFFLKTLKYISIAFEQLHAELTAQIDQGADPEDHLEYTAENVFFVPPSARWSFLQSSAKQPMIGKIVDDGMDAIEAENPQLKGILPKVTAVLNKFRL